MVIKLGTAAITLPDGRLNEGLLAECCRQINLLGNQYHVLLVSSGAVGSGMTAIKQYKATIYQKKAAAAVGNPLLMASYARHFAQFNITTAQCLLERAHFNNRKHFVQLRKTIETLWSSGILPIANDNDVVNDLELRFSDNDELATLLAVALDATQLLIGSTVDGLMDAAGKTIKQVNAIDEQLFTLVRPEKSAQGLGGMFSKLSHTRKATAMGIATTIFNARIPGNILLAAAGKTGTHFMPQKSSLNARQKWLKSGRIHGTICVDAGAAEALLARKSLLAVGIKKIAAPFVKGELVEITNPDGSVLAVGKSRMASAAINPTEKSQVVLHANDIMLIENE